MAVGFSAALLFVVIAPSFLAHLGGDDIAHIEQHTKEMLQEKMGSDVQIKSVSLVRDSNGKYSGFADTNKGFQLDLKVTVDGDRIFVQWKPLINPLELLNDK